MDDRWFVYYLLEQQSEFNKMQKFTRLTNFQNNPKASCNVK